MKAFITCIAMAMLSACCALVAMIKPWSIDVIVFLAILSITSAVIGIICLLNMQNVRQHLEEAIEKLQEQLDATKAERDKFAADAGTNANSIEQFKREIESLLQQKERLDGELTTVNERLTVANRKADEYRSQLHAMQAENEKLRSIINKHEEAKAEFERKREIERQRNAERARKRRAAKRAAKKGGNNE